MTIDTGDSSPKHQPVRRMPFAVRQQVAEQLKNMQEQGVITHSHSPWASPVVLVRKKDGSVRFTGVSTWSPRQTSFPFHALTIYLINLGRQSTFQHWTLPLGTGRCRCTLTLLRKLHSSHTRDSLSSM